MSDNYQAIYDAVHWAAESVRDEFARAAIAMQEVSAIYRPTLSIDGDKWCALYGDDLQSGVAGFGDSPAQAMDDFNVNWYRKLP